MTLNKHHINFQFPMCIVAGIITVALVLAAIYLAFVGINHLVDYYGLL